MNENPEHENLHFRGVKLLQALHWRRSLIKPTSETADMIGGKQTDKIQHNLQLLQFERVPHPWGLSGTEGLTGKQCSARTCALRNASIRLCLQTFPQMCWQVQSGPVALLLPSSSPVTPHLTSSPSPSIKSFKIHWKMWCSCSKNTHYIIHSLYRVQIRWVHQWYSASCQCDN